MVRLRLWLCVPTGSSGHHLYLPTTQPAAFFITWFPAFGKQVADPSLFTSRSRPSPLNCKNEYLVLALGEESANEIVMGSIVWAFGRLKNLRSRKMSARGCALHSVCPQLFFFLFGSHRLAIHSLTIGPVLHLENISTLNVRRVD